MSWKLLPSTEDGLFITVLFPQTGAIGRFPNLKPWHYVFLGEYYPYGIWNSNPNVGEVSVFFFVEIHAAYYRRMILARNQFLVGVDVKCIITVILRWYFLILHEGGGMNSDPNGTPKLGSKLDGV